MKKLLSLFLILSLFLFSSCGKASSEKLLARYADLANEYSSLAEKALSDSSFASIGTELSDLASLLLKQGEKLSEEELSDLSDAMKKLEAKLREFKKLK